MNLIIIAAALAVASAAKLDRTYLPPASAKSAGGSPGSLQTPFAGNSLNHGLGSIPKGSYTNDFQGVVVDAAAAGTRASEPGDSALGKPRISYGSTDSKVGSAAFKANPNGFQGDGQTAESQGFQSGNFQGHQNGFNQFQSQPGTQNNQNQGFESQNHHDQGFNQFESQGGSQNVRPRAELDRNANTVRFESDVGAENYHYAYETDNGISAEETGEAVNGVHAQGGYSYTGDDGQVYTVTYTADEGGFQPKGAHLPTPPPIPEEILKSLEQNARDEAAGLVDDGSYDAQKYNAGSDYTENENKNGQYHQSSVGHSETDATASGTFISQNNQPLKPSGNSASAQFASSPNRNLVSVPQPSGHEQYDHSSVQTGHVEGHGQNAELAHSALGNYNQQHLAQASGHQNQQHSAQSTGHQNQQYSAPLPGNEHQQYSGHNAEASSGFGYSHEQASVAPTSHQGQTHQGTFGSSPNTPSATVSQSAQSNSFGNQYLAPVNKPQSSSHVSSNKQYNAQTEKAVPLFQQNVEDVPHPQGPTTNSFGQQSFSQPISAQNQPLAPQPSSSATFQASRQQQFNMHLSRNEYLPPKSQAPIPSSSSANQQYNSNIQVPGHFQSQPARPQESHKAHSPSFSQTQGFNQPQTSNQVNYQGGHQFQPTPGSSVHKMQASGFTAHHATAVPQLELTTPLESSPQHVDAAPSATVASFASVNSHASNSRPQFNHNKHVNAPAPTAAANFASFNAQQTSRPQRPTNNIAPTQVPISTQANTQFSQGAQFGRQPQPFPQTSYNQSPQFASSTAMTFPQQPQAADDSYYYNQPSKPFSIPQGSRFSNAQTNKFNSVNQKPSYSQNNDFSASANSLSPQIGQVSGSGKYPRPPTIAPTLASQNVFNGITQASISSFPSDAPTQSTPSGHSQFHSASRPNYLQSNQYNSQQSYNQQAAVAPSQTPVTHQSQSFEPHSSHAEPAPSVPSQQYNGEIYEYKKPEQMLPAQEASQINSAAVDSVSSPQFGQKVTKVQGSPKPLEQSSNSQYTQQNAVAAPRSRVHQNTQSSFGVQSSRQPQVTRPSPERPVFGQKTQSFQAIQEQKPVSNQNAGFSSLGTFDAQGKSESASSFANKGEVFSAHRKPPSFDSETGYHY